MTTTKESIASVAESLGLSITCGEKKRGKKMTTIEKINEAASHISASKANDGNGYIYLADETNEWYRVTSDELVELSDLLHHTDADVRRDAYSHWCNSTGELIGNSDKARELQLID